MPGRNNSRNGAPGLCITATCCYRIQNKLGVYGISTLARFVYCDSLIAAPALQVLHRVNSSDIVITVIMIMSVS
jgi:hypothetical protein